jgi:hypothetical protein
VRRAVLAAALAALVGAPTAGAQLPPPQEPPPEQQSPDRITILAVFKTVTLGEPSFISGRFRRLENPEGEAVGYRDRTITLEEAPFPFAVFSPIATTVSDREGYWNFKIEPKLNSRYRAVAADPATMSEAKLVRVRIAVGLRASRSAVGRGGSVEFSGTAAPAHDGGSVLIQRRDPDGGNFKTVARTRLRDDGEQRSRYRRRVRIRADGVFRVRVDGDQDHLPGNSRSVAVRVGQ